MVNKRGTLFLVSMLLLVPTGTLFAQVDPDPETVPPKNIVVQATVGGLIAGPIEPAPATPPEDKDEDDEDDSDDGVASPKPASLTIFPRGSEEQYQGGILTQESIPRIVFVGTSPAFFGTGNVNGGIVTLQFSFGDFSYSASARLDGAGNWQWESPKTFPNGNYTVTAKLLDPFTFQEKDRQTLEFMQVNSTSIDMWRLVPLLEPGQQTTDIIVTPVAGYEQVRAGETFKARIHLFGFALQKNMVLEYIVLGPNGEVYLRQTESLEQRTSESFVKPFFTKENLVTGKYLLLVRAVSEEQVALGSTPFSIEKAIAQKEAEDNQKTSYFSERTSNIVIGSVALIFLINIALFFLLFDGTRFLFLSRFLFILTNIALLVGLFFLQNGL